MISSILILALLAMIIGHANCIVLDKMERERTTTQQAK
jgi:hypothetical protein